MQSAVKRALRTARFTLEIPVRLCYGVQPPPSCDKAHLCPGAHALGPFGIAAPPRRSNPARGPSKPFTSTSKSFAAAPQF